MKEYKYCVNCYTKNSPTDQECSVCGCKLEKIIVKKNILLTIIVSLIIFGLVFLVYKFCFKSADLDMKKIENIYYIVTFVIIYSLCNNYFNKPHNEIAQLIFLWPTIFFFINPPENLPPGITNLEYRKMIYRSSHERTNKIFDLTYAKSLMSIIINVGIIALLIFIYGFIATPLINILQTITVFIVLITLLLVPTIVFLLSLLRKR